MHADTSFPPATPARDSRLPALLRALGATALALGLYIFLMKGWQQGNDLSRFAILLAHSVGLVAAGLLSGHWLQESKGARLLVIMALASVPACFAISGAFLYATVQPEALQAYPRFVTWSLDSPPLALGCAGIAFLVLAPVAKLGFSVLARPVSWPLTALFLAANAALLVPLRDAHWVSALAGVMALVQLGCHPRVLGRHVAGRTREGLIASGLLFLPVAVLLGRSLWLYHPSFSIMLANGVLAYLVLRRASLSLADSHPGRQVLDLLAVFTAGWLASLPTGWLYFGDALPLQASLPLCLLGAAAMLYDTAWRNQPGRGLLRALAAFTYGLHWACWLVLFDGLFPAQMALLGGLAGIALGYQLGQRSLFMAGSVVTAFGALRALLWIYSHFNLGGWLTLALGGVALIVLASWMEARGDRLQGYLQGLRARYASWEY